MRMRVLTRDTYVKVEMATADREERLDFFSIITAHSLALDEFCSVLDGIIAYEEAIADGRLSGVDVSALILSAHVLFKRKEFAYVEPSKRKRVYEVLLKFALRSLNEYGSKESLIFLMLIAQLCTGKDILYDNVSLLRGVVSSYLGSLGGEKGESKAEDKPPDDKPADDKPADDNKQSDTTIVKETASADELFEKFNSFGFAPEYYLKADLYYSEHAVPEDDVTACLKQGRTVLKEMKGKKELLKFCLSLPVFKTLREECKAPSKFLMVGASEGVATNGELLDRIKQLYVAVQASLLVLTIPDTLEPLNEEQLSQVKELLCLLLQAAVAAYAVPVASLTKTAQPDNESKQQSDQQEQHAADKEEGLDINKMTSVVDILQQLQSSKTVEMVCSMQNIVNALHAIIMSSLKACSCVESDIMESSRVSGHVLLNLWVLIAYNIFAGLQSLLIGKPVIEQDVPAGSKSSTTMSYAKLAGWSVDLVTKGVQVLCQLVQDLEFDEVSSTKEDQVIPFADHLDIFGSYTPWQRIRMLIASIPLVDVLFTLLCSSYKKAVQVVKSSSATTVSDSAESTSSAATATATAKPQSKKPDTKPPDAAAGGTDKKDGESATEDMTPAEEHTGNSPPLSIASSDDICEYNLFSDEDTESDASLEPWPNFPVCGMQWSTPSDINFEQATPVTVPAIPPPPPPLPPKRKVSLPKSEQVSVVMPRLPLLPPRGKTTSSDNKLQDGARRKPALFIRLAQCVVECLLAGIEHTHHKSYQDYLRASLSMEHVSQLAQVIQSVDMITSEEASKYKQLMEVEEFGQFTEKLLQLVQEMISSGILKHSLQDVLLNELGLSTRCWPLHILPRSLFILARLLICRLKSSSSQQDDDPLCLSIWNGMLTSLEINASTDSKEGEVTEDLDVANLQLLLVVFQRLSPSSKSVLLSRCVGALIKVSAVVRGGTVVSSLAVSRLLLVFDYMVHLLSGERNSSHFKKLLEQVDKNIFKRTQTTLQSSAAIPDHYSSPLEANYRAVLSKVCTKKATEDDTNKKQKNKKTEQKPSVIDAMIPRFYEIRKRAVDDGEQLVEEEDREDEEDEVEVIKLLLTYSESEGGYSDLYDALLTLMVTGVDDVSSMESLQSRILSAMATRHCFSLCWDLLGYLPPSGKFLQLLLDQNSFSVKDSISASRCLHSLRICFKLSSQLIDPGDITDALATAGQDDAEELVDKVISLSAKNQTSLFAITVLSELCEDTSLTQPSLLTIIAVDTLISLLDIEISSFLPSPDGKAEPESKKSEAKASTDTIDTTKDTKSDGKSTDGTATKVADAKPALVKKAVLLSDEDKRNVDTLSLLCSRLLPKFISYAHNFILSSMKDCGPGASAEKSLNKVYDVLLSIAGFKSSTIGENITLFANYLPDVIKEQLKIWSSSLLLREEKNYADKQRKEALFSISLQVHFASFAGYRPFDSSRSLKTTIVCLLRLCSNLQILSPDDNFGHFIAPLYNDAVGSFIRENKMEYAWGDEKSLALDSSKILIVNCFQLINSPELQSHTMFCGILEDTLSLFDYLLDISAVWPALSLLDVNDPPTDLANLILASTKPSIPSSIACQGVTVLQKAVAAGNKLVEPHLVVLCRHISSLANRSAETREWLRKLLFGHEDDVESQTVTNMDWLKKFIVAIVEEDCSVDRSLCSVLLEHILVLGGELLDDMVDKKKALPQFPGLLSCVFTLAPLVDHSYLLIIKTLSSWIPNGMKFLNMEFEDNKVKESLLDMMVSIVEHISTITTALQYIYDKEQYITANELACDTDSILHDTDSECGDEICVDEEDSGAEDSDDESINSKLCTFTHTQREFTEQHWYHCHTCKLVDGTGVCTVCAKVCHKGHELSYSKCGSFFCDCGAKEDKSCQALVKRVSGTAGSSKAATASDGSKSFAAVPFGSSIAKKTKKVSTHKKSKDSQTGEKAAVTPPGPLPAVLKVAENIKDYKKELSECLDQCKLFTYCGELFNKLASAVMSSKTTLYGQSCNAIAKQNLHNLHYSEKKISHVESIMSATLGSQEGTFDNIRMNTSGDQAQVIRGLLNKFAIRRVAMCCMSSGKGRKQHLVVSHDKGKLTVLQLSSLLKQADSNRRKLTLTRLGSATLPFTVLSLAINPCAEDYLAVCGLKECHVLSFNSSGQQADHLGLHPSVDSSGYIVKALWVPGSQTELAVVTDTFVKMYDLSVDVISPSYYFIALTGKIMDATFVVTNSDKFLIAMMSNGTMYCQPVIPACSATDGPVYFTIDIQVKHPEMAEPIEGVILGGGASVYYSHALQLLFFGYSQGKSFVAHFHHTYASFDQVFYIPLKSNGKASPQALVQWTEVSNHPGLVFALLQSTSNPVVLLMKQDEIQVHELKVFSSKAKVQGMVALRQLSAGEKGSQPRTTFILLCEDGSLRIYLANNNENNNCWLHPIYQPSSPLASLKFKAKKKSKQQAHGQEALKFPIDFFEHCQQMQNEDVEFGGSDLLHVYNAQQIKNRFNSAGVYVVNTRMSGFTVEVSNNQHKNTVMVGVRVMLGSRSLDRAPSYIECFGRTIQVAFPSGTVRWFDFPFTREESLTADKSFKIIFGPSIDPSGVSFVDCIKAYCKAKDVFGWTEKSAADATASTAARMPAPSSSSKSSAAASAAASSAATDDGSGGVDEVDELLSMPINTKIVTSTDMLLCNVVTVLSNIYLLAKQESSPVSLAETISHLLTMNLPQRLQHHCKFMLATLLPDKEKYYLHKDETQLYHVINTLYDDISSIDSETFQYQLQVLLAIAKARPMNLAQLADSTFITKALLANKARIAITELSSEREEASEASVQVTSDQDDDQDGKAEEEATTAKPVASAQLATVDVHVDFISQMTSMFWQMYHQRPFSTSVAPIAPQGLIGVQTTVQAMVEVMWGFMEASPTNVIIVLPHLVEMLLSEDFQISSSCAQTLMYLMRSRRKSVKPPAQDKTTGDDAPSDKSKPTGTDQKSKDQTEGEGSSPAAAMWNAPIEDEAVVAVTEQAQQQEQQVAVQEGGQDQGEEDEEEEGDDDDDEEEEGEQEGSQEVPAVQQQLGELLVAMQGVFENPAEIMEQFVQNPEQMMMMMQGILPALDPDAMLNLAISMSMQEGSQQEQQQQQQQSSGDQQEQEQQQEEEEEEEQPEPSDDVVNENVNELQEDEDFYRCLDDPVDVPAPQEPQQEVAKVTRRPSLSSGTLTPPDMIIPLQSGEGNKQPSESAAGEIVTASSPVNEDGNVSSEPELAADSSGEEGQDPAVAEDIDQQINEDSSVDVGTSSKQDHDDGPEMERENKLQEIRLKLLEGLIDRLSQLETVGGLRSVPFLQLLYSLTGYLELPKPNKPILYKLLRAIINTLGIKSEIKDASDRIKRSKRFEVHLLLVRFFNILLQQGKKRKEDSSTNTQSSSKRGQYLWFFTAKVLLEESNCMQFCYKVLLALLDIKDRLMTKEENLSLPGALLKAHVTSTPGDLSPFFQRQYVKGHGDDIFEPYHRLWAEIVLFLPCQLKKLSQCTKHIKQYTFSDNWTQKLCEFTMVAMQPAGIGRRYVRKLLLSVCGSKDKYRLVRDLHTLKFHLNSIRSICQTGGYNVDVYAPPPATLSYDTLLTLIEHFDACSEVATSRVHNWQSLCVEDPSVLPFLMRISLQLSEEMAPLIVKLITTALSGVPFHAKTDSHKHSHQSSGSKGTSKSTDSSTKSKTTSTKQPAPDKEMCSALVQQLMNYELEHHILSIFVLTFMLQSNSSTLKWIVHSMMQHVYQGSNFHQQVYLLEEVMWNLWPHVPAYGNRASQFVDLLGYFSITANDDIMQKKPSLCKQFAEKSFAVLNLQNKVVSTHPNGHIYNQLSSLVDFDGYYLESEPCLICNDPEVPYSVVRLTSIKSEVRYSPTLILVRLTGSYMFSQISIKISDIKRTKMVRTINIYYTNRTVQNAIELKNKRNLWRKAKTCHLTAGQTEVKIDFSLPIIACNVMIEFAEFYDNLQASPEMLQCPRCSASVPAHPGVCGTCGENVYQCHKCRAINYDERDPFLCNSCGYSKYAKFETTVSGKSCAAVDPIESEEDRKKTLTSINTLLERADKKYKQLVNHKNELDLLLRCVSNDGGVNVSSSSTPGSTGVNKSIQSVAQRYCGDCKGTYHELSKLIRGVMASRKELVEYDRTKQMSKSPDTEPSTPIITPSTASTSSLTLSYVDVQADVTPSSSAKAGKCYGCASATIEYCITLLRALATLPDIRQVLVEQGLIQELVDYNQRSGSAKVQKEVRDLLCLLTKNNAEATATLNEIILSRIMISIANQNVNPNFASAIHPEMLLLTACLEMEDSCWEQRLRAVVSLFQQTQHQCNPVVMEYVTLPCLNILKSIISPSTKPLGKANEKKAWHEIGSVPFGGTSVEVDAAQWLTANPNMTFAAWKEKASQKLSHIKSLNKQETHDYRLMEKYGLKWKQKAHKVSTAKSQLRHSTWLRRMLFNSSSRSIRLSACAMVTCLCVGDVKKKEMLDLLASYLDEVGKAGENATEFLGLFQNLINDSQWKFYLASRGILPTIGQLITKEITMLSKLEETSLSSDLSQGYALQMLTLLLNSFCKHDKIRLQYKNKLVGVVLNGYLALRRLVVQRTKRIDDTQDMLLELLENMTSGTEDERKDFMEVCVKTLDNYSKHDMVTPIFIFERLCNIIKPETEDVGHFCLSLDKDPQQEEFLQGRMQGNPYSSLEPGLGPLMRDIKNKICTDCELVALLEDDSGMELLVCNKIISLDLPVKDVYKKIWCTRPNANNQRNEVMHVVYRMRGLLGDATEDMIESLDSGGNKEEDEEEVYQMASVLAKCGGIEAMLSRLYYVKNLHQGYQLVSVILKLLGYCFKLKVNRQYAIQSQLNTLNCLLTILNRALFYEQEYSNGIGAQLAEKVLLVMENVLQEASSSQQVIIRQDSQQNVIPEEQSELGMLLGHMQSPYVQSTPSIREALMHVIPFLTFGDPTNMQNLISHFAPYLDFSAFDSQHSPENALYLDCFSVVANGISNDASGEKLKDLMIEKNMVHSGVAYIKEHVPDQSKEFESSEWKDCISRPSLPYVLKILTGLAQHHTQTQILVGEVIPQLHLMEQVSSSEHIGTMAENLLRVLSENETVHSQIDEVRSATRAEKKRKAMAMRDKQLKAFGMTVNEKGQVIASSKHLKEMEKDLADEPGLKCCICLEGYNNQPKKVLGVYTYNRKVTLDEFENKARKTQGFCSVSHFNVIHFECHTSAVKLAKGRDVWESAMLQNANTKCNAILPIWGPEVPEAQFENCLSHHTTQLQAITGWYVHSFNLFLHDLRLLLLRFAHEQSFSVDSGGGGPQSNLYYFPYVLHIGIYLLNVNSRSYQNEEKTLQNFLVTTPDKWVSFSYELDGPMCMVVMSLFLQNFEQWKESRMVYLKRLLILAHVRNVSPAHIKQLPQDNCTPAQFSTYKPMLILFALVNELQKWFKKSLSQKGAELPKALMDFIRNNNAAVSEISEKVLEFYQKELLPMESFEEFCDVAELLEEIPAPQTFISDLLATVVTKPS